MFCTALVLSIALLGAPLMAEGPIVTRGQSIKNDVSPPLRDMIREAKPPTTSVRTEIPIMMPERPARPDVDQGPDPVRQTEFRPFPELGLTPGPMLSVEGNDEDDNIATVGVAIVPPDTNGDIGTTQYVQWINLVYSVYDKATGARTAGPFAGNAFFTGFGGTCESTNDGDPLVMFDDVAQRWVVSQFSIFAGTQCVAVSTSDDALGTYNRYAFVITPGGNNDYPKMGVWADSGDQSAYAFTSRDFGGAGGAFSNAAGVFERDAMLAGAPAQFIKFSFPCTGADCREGTLPPHMEGAAQPPAGTCPTFFTYFDAQFDDGPSTIDGVRNDTLCVDWNTIGNSTLTEGPFIATAAFDRGLGNGFSDCISPVGGGGEPLDCLAIFTMWRAPYRWDGSSAEVLLNLTVDAGSNNGGVRWNELTSADGQTGWSDVQGGTYSPDNNDRWMGSIASDKFGNFALGYSYTDAGTPPAVRYTSRMAGDPLGTMPGGEVSCHEGTGAQIGSSNRWGDYSSMSVDPVDDCTFWYTQEYYETTSSFNFKTRICKFAFDECTGGGGIPCGDIQRFQARCQPNGRVQYRVIMTDNSHDGETVTFQIDGANDQTRTIVNGRAQGQQVGFAPGAHTVTLSDPAGCFPDRVVNCP